MLAHVAPLRRCFHAGFPRWADIVVVVPHMSESISEGIVSNLPKAVGTSVAIDDIVAELETDKVRIRTIRSVKVPRLCKDWSMMRAPNKFQ